MRKKITIIGGGLAGISLGIGLRKRDVPVKLIEAGFYPRHRVCGEFISGISTDALKYIGIDGILDGMPRHRTSVWYCQGKRSFQSDLPEEAVGVSRYKLDKDLIDRFEALGGELITGTRYTGDDSEGYVFSTGRVRRKGSKWIGIKCHLIDFPLEADVEMHVGKGAYLGVSRVEENRVDACGLFEIRPQIKVPKMELLETYLEACNLTEMSARVRNANKDESSCLGVNAFELGWQPEEPEDRDKLRIGDRFAIIGPFSGNGMSMAFEGAAAAIDPLLAYASGEMEWLDCRDQITLDLKKRFRKRLAISNAIHPFLTDAGKQRMLATLGKLNLIPYNTLFRALR